MKKEKVKIGIIGLGRISKVHIDGYQNVEDSHLIAVADVNKKALTEISKVKGIPYPFSDYRKMLELKELDAVSICLPNFLHKQAAVDALEAGKHVLLEKPLALNALEGEEILKAAKRSQKKFMVAFNQRFREDMQVLKTFIMKGVLGKIYYAKTGWLRQSGVRGANTWFNTKSKSGGGTLIDIGVHMLDLTLWLMGNLKPVSVVGYTYAMYRDKLKNKKDERVPDVEDLAAAFIRLENGHTIILEVNRASYIEKEKIYLSISGTKGEAKIDPLRIFTHFHDRLVDITPRIKPPICDNTYHAEIKHFIECIRKDKEPLCTGEQGLVIMKILDAIYKSSRKEKEIKIE